MLNASFGFPIISKKQLKLIWSVFKSVHSSWCITPTICKISRVSINDIGTIVFVRYYITQFWFKRNYFAVPQQYSTRRSADHYLPVHITAVIKKKRASDARWKAWCKADNQLKDIFDESVPNKGRMLTKTSVKNFPQPIALFIFFSEVLRASSICCISNLLEQWEKRSEHVWLW